eukprot:gene5334-5366_t
MDENFTKAFLTDDVLGVPFEKARELIVVLPLGQKLEVSLCQPSPSYATMGSTVALWARTATRKFGSCGRAWVTDPCMCRPRRGTRPRYDVPPTHRCRHGRALGSGCVALALLLVIPPAPAGTCTWLRRCAHQAFPWRSAWYRLVPEPGRVHPGAHAQMQHERTCGLSTAGAPEAYPVVSPPRNHLGMQPPPWEPAALAAAAAPRSNGPSTNPRAAECPCACACVGAVVPLDYLRCAAVLFTRKRSCHHGRTPLGHVALLAGPSPMGPRIEGLDDRFRHLRRLVLSNHAIRRMDGLGRLACLETLSLAHNAVDRLPPLT